MKLKIDDRLRALAQKIKDETPSAEEFFRLAGALHTEAPEAGAPCLVLVASRLGVSMTEMVKLSRRKNDPALAVIPTACKVLITDADDLAAARYLLWSEALANQLLKELDDSFDHQTFNAVARKVFRDRVGRDPTDDDLADPAASP